MFKVAGEEKLFLMTFLQSIVITYIVNPIPLNYMHINVIITEYLKVLSHIQKNKIAVILVYYELPSLVPS